MMPEIKTLCLRGNGCHVSMLVCVLYFNAYVYVCIHCIQTNVCVSLFSTKGIDDVALNKKIKFVCLL